MYFFLPPCKCQTPLDSPMNTFSQRRAFCWALSICHYRYNYGWYFSSSSAKCQVSTRDVSSSPTRTPPPSLLFSFFSSTSATPRGEVPTLLPNWASCPTLYANQAPTTFCLSATLSLFPSCSLTLSLSCPTHTAHVICHAFTHIFWLLSLDF